MVLDFAGRKPEALQSYLDAVEGGMWLPPALERHMDLLARSGQRDEAIRILALPANSNNPELSAAAQRLQAGQPAVATPLTPARGAAATLYGLAAIYLQQGDRTDGLATLTLALALDPQLDAARLAFAQAQSDLHNTDLAMATLHSVSPQSPYASSARVMEAWALVNNGRSDEGVALAREAADAGDMRAKRALADIYRNLHRDAEAEPIYSELIASTPDDWHVWFARGAARVGMGRAADGEADMQHALQLSPEQPDVMNYLGYTWVDRGEHVSEGVAMLQRAAALKPNSGPIADSLGWAYYRMRDYQNARDNLEHAVELLPADATLNDHLGDVYWRLNRHTDARYQWQRALTFSPADASAIQAKVDHGLPAETATAPAHR
jgi:tetratricopeptide (TPR) repeat protein